MTTSENTPLLNSNGNHNSNKSGSSVTPWLPGVEFRILLAAFILSAALSLSQIPILYAFRNMVCELFYSQHPTYPEIGNRCNRNEVEAGVAVQYTLLGLTSIVCSLLNLVLTGWQVRRWGLKTALLISISFPILRSSVQALCILVGGLPGIILMHLSQILGIFGGTGGGALVLNVTITEIVTAKARTGSLSKLAGSIMFGNAVGFKLGGTIADWLGIQAPFFCSAGVLALTLIYIVFTLPSTSTNNSATAKSANPERIRNPATFKPSWIMGVLAPQSRTLGDGSIVKYYGPLILAVGTFTSLLATANVPTLLVMYSLATFRFAPSQSSTLMALNSLMRSIFLIFVFPRIVACSKSRFSVANKTVEAAASAATQGLADANAASDVIMPATTESNAGFDLTVLRWSVVTDALLTGATAFTSQPWHMYLVGGLQPLASGIVPASKGVMAEICLPSERADALQIMAMIEYLATLATVAVSGLIYSFFVDLKKGHVIFFCSSTVAVVAAVVLLFCRAPPDNSVPEARHELINSTSA